MNAAAETGRNPVIEHDQIQPDELGEENEEADAGWNGQIRLGRPNSQEIQGNVIFPCSADHEQTS